MNYQTTVMGEVPVANPFEQIQDASIKVAGAALDLVSAAEKIFGGIATNYAHPLSHGNSHASAPVPGLSDYAADLRHAAQLLRLVTEHMRSLAPTQEAQSSTVRR